MFLPKIFLASPTDSSLRKLRCRSEASDEEEEWEEDPEEEEEEEEEEELGDRRRCLELDFDLERPREAFFFLCFLALLEALSSALILARFFSFWRALAFFSRARAFFFSFSFLCFFLDFRDLASEEEEEEEEEELDDEDEEAEEEAEGALVVAP